MTEDVDTDTTPDLAESSEDGFLSAYDPSAFPAVAVATDVVVLTVRDGELSVLLVERGEHPHRGEWALPGGFVRPDEDLDTAAARELAEETGVAADSFHLEQLKSYGGPDRDPRMRVVSVAYLAFAPGLGDPDAGGDAARARFWPVRELGLGLFPGEDAEAGSPQLAFDHATIVTDGVERARAKLEYTTLATSFVPSPFTISELRGVYESVWGVELHAGNFHRKVLAVDGFVSALGKNAERPGKPGPQAALFARGRATAVHPPLLRPDPA